jgi:ribonuclease J
VPDDEKGLHASGHASGPDLLEIAREIGPEVLIPVHSECPGFYIDRLGDSRIGIVLPTVGTTIEI